MNSKRKLISILTGLLIMLGSLVMTSSPASAQESTVDVEITPPGDCGETTFTTEWAEGAREVSNTVLVVQVGDEQLVAHIGESVDIGPFDQETVDVRWRVWGGAERDHDNPPLDSLDALLEYLDVHSDGELHMDPPGVAWHEISLNGCTADPSESPSATPTVTATAEPSATASESPEAMLPVTGASSRWLLNAGIVALVLGLAGVGAALYYQRRRAAAGNS